LVNGGFSLRSRRRRERRAPKRLHEGRRTRGDPGL